MLCNSLETMAVKCWPASEKEGLELSTKSVEEDQGPVCIRVYCRWMFNGQVIFLPQTEKTPLKCKLTSSDLSRAQPWYAIVCVVPGKGRVRQSLEDSKALCRQADASGDNGIQREVTAQLHPFMQEESTLGELTEEGACHVSWVLNQVQLLNDNVKERKSGICSGTDRTSPEKLLQVTGYPPRP